MQWTKAPQELVDTVIIRQILDANVLHAAILAGELDLTMSLVESDRAEALQAQWG